tara:strand:+ start:216 stop:515 length:300 start_codon:yes stop_codon:yes gene_type:complete
MMFVQFGAGLRSGHFAPFFFALWKLSMLTCTLVNFDCCFSCCRLFRQVLAQKTTQTEQQAKKLREHKQQTKNTAKAFQAPSKPSKPRKTKRVQVKLVSV